MSLRITYFVHGTTLDNESKMCTGWNPGELSELGIKQSKELAEQTKNIKFDLIISSDLKRAVDSATISWPDREVLQDERLRECNYGKYNGMEKKYVAYEDHILNSFKNGESMQDVEKRMMNLLKELRVKYDGKHIAFVAHRAPQLALEVITKGISWEQTIKDDWRKKKAWKPGWEYVV